MLKLFNVLCDGSQWRTPHRVTESTECERQIASGTRLQRWRQSEQEGRRSEWIEVRQARLDRRCVHGEESVAFSGSISVELDSECLSCQLAMKIKNLILKMLHHSSTHQ